MTGLYSKIITFTNSLCTDSSPFLNWNEETYYTVVEKAVVFQSLVALLKLQPALDVSLEAKAAKFLESVVARNRDFADSFLDSLASNSDDSKTYFVQCMSVLISSASRVITTAAMKMLDSLMKWCSHHQKLELVKADLIPQLIDTLHPQSFSFAEAVDIHKCLMKIVDLSIWLTTSNGLTKLGFEDPTEQQAVHETVLKQVLVPSEKYILHLCVNRFSIIDGDQSAIFLELLTRLLEISLCYQPTMDFVLHIPVVLTIPSCLSFFDHDLSIWVFLYYIVDGQQKWNKTRGEVRRMMKTALRMLRTEGIEDVIEAKLQNDKKEYFGRRVVYYSFNWNSQQGMNLPKHE
ncbi:hypothetical protein BLNAU_11175 [Blattamonas nauphoetae]|uniref:Uncharacterized protein n=1 Tax=Blattamonas nauphoetae TaxID=2049346 RepID=A0ABQ9XQU9_9EUKA|nr:hypothetical protein BLNAU_11175 [Blattamonas nauphoetae]